MDCSYASNYSVKCSQRGRALWIWITQRLENALLLANIIVSQIQISLFCDLYTGVSQDLTEGEQIHAIHQGVFSSLLEVIDVLANHVLCDLVDAINFKFVAQSSLE